MPALPRHLRGPALVALCAVAACLVCAAAWAQAPDLAPAAVPTAAPAADPTLALLQALGPTGTMIAGLGMWWKMNGSKAGAATESADAARIQRLEAEMSDLRVQVALTRQALAHVRDTLREAADD